MSTVAWDGKSLAADKQATNNGTKSICTKIKRLGDGTILAYVGNNAAGLMMVRWYENGADESRFPECQKENEYWAFLIIVKPSRSVYVYEKWPIPVPLQEEFYGWGSGRDIVLGALAAGASAEKAIEIASKYDTSTGMGVESFTL